MPPLPETEGLEPCQAGDISFIELPGVCVERRAMSCLLDEMVRDMNWS